MKTRKSTAIAAALGGVAAAGAGADPADAMLPADAGGGGTPSKTPPKTPPKSGHPTQGQAVTEAPTPPPREVDPTPAPNPYAGKPKVGPAGEQVPVVEAQPRRKPVVNPKPKVLPGGAEQPVSDPQPPRRQVRDRVQQPPAAPVGDTQNEGAPERNVRLYEDAKRYASALDQLEANGGAMNMGLSRTMQELGGRERVTRAAKRIRATRDEQDDALESGDVATQNVPGRFGLREVEEDTGSGSPLDDLQERYPRVTVDDVLADGNRKLRGLPEDNDALDGVPGVEGYQFNEGDEDTDHFHPQGLTDGPNGSHVVSWWGQPGGDGPTDRGRVSFVNRSNGTYRHALLVEPTGGGEFDQVETHAGGMVRRGDKLYVAQTHGGIDVFDTSEMVEVDDEEQDADGYKYLLPRVASYENVGEQMRFSTLSIDESDPDEPALVVGEYIDPEKDGPNRNTQVVRFNLDANGVPDESAAAAYETTRKMVQGVAMHDGKFFMASGAPEGSTGELYTGRAGLGGLNVTHPWSDGVESLYVEGDRIWTVTEHPGRRVVHGSPMSSYPG